MSELGNDVKIQNLKRMSALLEIRPKDVKEQMMMRFDEIGENYGNLKAKAVSHTTNKTEQTRGGQMEHFARDCRRKGKGKGTGGDGGKGYAKGKGKTKERFRQSWRIQMRIFRRTEWLDRW